MSSATTRKSLEVNAEAAEPAPAAGRYLPEHAELSRSREHVALAHRALRCCHVKSNGLRCGSPALRGNVLCFFHEKWLNSAADDVLPPLEDGNGVQFALMYMVSQLRRDAFRNGEANVPVVKQLLYALQTASHNLRNCNFEPQLASPVPTLFPTEEDDRASSAAKKPAAPDLR